MTNENPTAGCYGLTILDQDAMGLMTLEYRVVLSKWNLWRPWIVVEYLYGEKKPNRVLAKLRHSWMAETVCEEATRRHIVRRVRAGLNAVTAKGGVGSPEVGAR